MYTKMWKKIGYGLLGRFSQIWLWNEILKSTSLIVFQYIWLHTVTKYRGPGNFFIKKNSQLLAIENLKKHFIWFHFLISHFGEISPVK